MQRKKWTPVEEITNAGLKLRENKKWQIALRRYLIEKNPCVYYAPYFGLDIESLREWVEIQFVNGINWENFGTAWQIDHIIPVSYFDVGNEEDLKLCWSFINIKIGKTANGEIDFEGTNILAARSYFENLYKTTNLSLCKRMLKKIENIEVSQSDNKDLQNFIVSRLDYIEALSHLEAAEYRKINDGESLPDILLEKEILKKFGA